MSYLLDDPQLVIIDGCHKPKWGCCMFDDIRFREMYPLRIPYGCENDRLPQSDVCRPHVRYLGRRTPLRDGGDAVVGERIYTDHARADCYAQTRKTEEAASVQQVAARGKAPAGGGGAAAASGGAAASSGGKAPAPRSTTQTRAQAQLQRTKDARKESIRKLEESRSFRDLILTLEKKEEEQRKRLADVSDADRVLMAFGGYLKPEDVLTGDAKAWYGVGDNAFLVDEIVGSETRGLNQKYYWVKFKGWTSATLEPADNLQQWHIDAYEEALARGEEVAQIFSKDQAMPSNPNLPDDVLTMNGTEFAESLAKSDCCCLKIAQLGEPPAGYLHTTAGVLIVAGERSHIASHRHYLELSHCSLDTDNGV